MTIMPTARNPFSRLFGLPDEELAAECRKGYDGETPFVDEIELIRAELHRRRGNEPVTREDKLAHLAVIADEDMPQEAKAASLNMLLVTSVLIDPVHVEGSSPTPVNYPEDVSFPDHSLGNV